jgi:hypothetical protein
MVEGEEVGGGVDMGGIDKGGDRRDSGKL